MGDIYIYGLSDAVFAFCDFVAVTWIRLENQFNKHRRINYIYLNGNYSKFVNAKFKLKY